MGTKNDPGKFDCYANAEPDEPMFILLGRDPCAPILVEFWAKLRQFKGADKGSQQLLDARACADAMSEWLRKLGKGEADEDDLYAVMNDAENHK